MTFVFKAINRVRPGNQLRFGPTREGPDGRQPGHIKKGQQLETASPNSFRFYDARFHMCTLLFIKERFVMQVLFIIKHI